VYVDNYLDSYHIPVVHPGLMKEIDYPRATAPKPFAIIHNNYVR
jgi:hypothetical protein